MTARSFRQLAPLATALLLASVGPELRGRASGLYQGGFLLGGMTGPAIGGLLAGVSLTAPFYFYAGTLVIAGTIAFTQLHDPPGMEEAASIPPTRSLRDHPPHEGEEETRASSSAKRDRPKGKGRFRQRRRPLSF